MKELGAHLIIDAWETRGDVLNDPERIRAALIAAVDAVGAGAHEVVLFASGSSARQTDVTRDRPVDAVIMAIVDSFDAHGQTTHLH